MTSIPAFMNEKAAVVMTALAPGAGPPANRTATRLIGDVSALDISEIRRSGFQKHAFNERGIVATVDELGVLQYAIMERGGGVNAFHGQLAEGAAHGRNGFLASRPV